MVVCTIFFYTYKKLDDVLRMTVEEGTNVGDGYCQELDAGFRRCPGDVWGEVGVGLIQQGIGGLWRLLSQHIGAESSQPSFRQCIGHGLIVDQRSAACIDEDRRRLHHRQCFTVNQVVCLFRQRTMQREYVRGGEQFFERSLCNSYGQRLGFLTG